jgi:hypothetical protein
MIFVPQISPEPTTLHVIVNNLPSASGPSIWVTTLVSAVVGMLSGSLMEMIKPYLGRAVIKSKMTPQLIDELRQNLRILETIEGVTYESSSDPHDVDRFTYYLAQISDARFRYYLANQTLAVYEADRTKSLQKFYELATKDIPGIIEKATDTEKEEDERWVYLLLQDMVGNGKRFLALKRPAMWWLEFKGSLYLIWERMLVR